MREVTVRKGEPIDRALKRLKTKLDVEGILDEMRRRRAQQLGTGGVGVKAQLFHLVLAHGGDHRRGGQIGAFVGVQFDVLLILRLLPGCVGGDSGQGGGKKTGLRRFSAQAASFDGLAGVRDGLARLMVRTGHQGGQVPDDVLAHAVHQFPPFLSDGDHDLASVLGRAHAGQVAHFLEFVHHAGRRRRGMAHLLRDAGHAQEVLAGQIGQQEKLRVGNLAFIQFRRKVENAGTLGEQDEVRQLGRELGLPEYLVMRQPFPGPGLGIRVIGALTKEKLDMLREADFIFREEIAKAGLERELSQYFAALTNMRSVGVMGDGRTYDYTLALRSVTTTDFMTADWARIPYDVLDKVSVRIVNEVKGINRIVYDITSKPPATIEWE